MDNRKMTETYENGAVHNAADKNQSTDFKAVFVNSGDQYTQESYNSILNENKEKKAHLWAWKNDRAVAEIAILSGDKTLENIYASATDLSNESNSISSSQINISFIKEVKAFAGHAGWYANNPANIMPRGKREFYPEVIYSSDPVSINPKRIQLIWVDIDVPKEAKSGIYYSQITICAENTSDAITLDIELEILDLTMPDSTDYMFDVEYWSHPYNVAYYYGVDAFSDEHLQILKKHMQLYKKLGGHAITASITQEAWGGQTYGGNNKVHYPSMIKWIKKSNGEWQFDYTHFDKWVQLNKDIGIADKIICYSMMPWKSIVRYYDESKRKEKKMLANPAQAKTYAKVWTPFLIDFIKHLDEKGWFDTTYIGFDERRNMQTALDLIESIKNKDGKTLKVSAAFNDFINNKSVFDRLDYASVGLQEIRDSLDEFKNQAADRKAKGKEITMYTATEHVPNSFTKSIPVESYWTIMYAGALGTTGFLRWAFDAWVEDPLRDSTHWSFPAGDCFLVYPSEKDDKEKTSRYSLRLAKLDEGVRDINKLYLMRENSEELANAVEKLLSQVNGDSENSYEFNIVSKTNIWGRKAKWLTQDGKNAMLHDMAKIKQGIYEISLAYAKENEKED